MRTGDDRNIQTDGRTKAEILNNILKGHWLDRGLTILIEEKEMDPLTKIFGQPIEEGLTEAIAQEMILRGFRPKQIFSASFSPELRRLTFKRLRPATDPPH